MQSHFLLSLNVIKEHKGAIVSLAKQLETVNTRLNAHDATLKDLASANNETVKNLRNLNEAVQGSTTMLAKVLNSDYRRYGW